MQKDSAVRERSVSGAADGGGVKEEADWERVQVSPETEIVELEEGLSVVRYEGDYGFEGFWSRAARIPTGAWRNI